MDTASTLMGLGLLAIFVMPVFYLIWQQNNKERNRLKSLKTLSAKNNINTDTFEISATLLLGLDSKSKKLLVVEPANNMQHMVLDLSDIKHSKVTTSASTVDKNGLKRISLDLSGKSQNRNHTEIIFFDEDDNENNNASERLLIANKWNKIIAEKLSA